MCIKIYTDSINNLSEEFNTLKGLNLGVKNAKSIEELIKMSSQIDDGMAAKLRDAFSRTSYKIK